MQTEKTLDFPIGYDTLASRYAMQAIFTVWVVLGDGQRLLAADLAAKSIDDLIQGEDKQWHRRFNARGVTLDPATEKTRPAFGVPDPDETTPSNDPALLPASA